MRFHQEKVQKRNAKHPGHIFRHYSSKWQHLLTEVLLLCGSVINRHTETEQCAPVTTKLLEGLWTIEKAAFKSSSWVGVWNDSVPIFLSSLYASVRRGSGVTVAFLIHFFRGTGRDVPAIECRENLPAHSFLQSPSFWACDMNTTCKLFRCFVSLLHTWQVHARTSRGDQQRLHSPVTPRCVL